jgi:hypothetical protein
MNEFSVKLDVVLGERTTGKTTDLLNVAIKQMVQGRDVLFLSPTRMMARYTFETIYDYIPRSKLFCFDRTNLQVIYKGIEIKFIAYDEINSAHYYPRHYEKHFKIIDNAEMILPRADVISINGNYKKPTLDGVRDYET